MKNLIRPNRHLWPVCFNNQRRRRLLGLLCSLLRRRIPVVNQRAVAASRLCREPTTIRSRR
ncbi:hypothetical protein Hanom_Chr09g00868311 [Helianthus anomalus]